MNRNADNSYNEYCFTEDNGEKHELTVTITLCEYRNNIRDIARYEIETERLKDKVKELQKTNDKLLEAVSSCKETGS